MKTEKIEDKVVLNIPVYLSKGLQDQLYLLQYPNRPQNFTYDDETILQARIKPINELIELEVGLRTRTPVFSRSKAEQIAINVDGAFRHEKSDEDNYYSGNMMDKLVLTSAKNHLDIRTAALGVMSDGTFHITSLKSVISMKPSFSYLDLAENRSQKDQKSYVEENKTEETAKRVTVRFERPETDRSKDLKEKSYASLQKRLQSEAWINLDYNRFGSERSEFESRFLYCSHPEEVIDRFLLSDEEYLGNLIPKNVEPECVNPGLPANYMSLSALKSMPLEDQVKIIIQKACVASFNEILCLRANKNSNEDHISVVRVIEQHAVLVQGNWVIKSELFYPKEYSSEYNVSNELLQRARDCILYLFTKSTTINRSNITELINIPAEEITKILKGVARFKNGKKTWDFVVPTDNNFIKKYPDVVQRQKMIWQLRYENILQTFKKIK
ncbi:UNVERIFIED_CONTAM: hypothetical protein RMT77_017455 [Armadillidium vulgare]